MPDVPELRERSETFLKVEVHSTCLLYISSEAKLPAAAELLRVSEACLVFVVASRCSQKSFREEGRLPAVLAQQFVTEVPEAGHIA